MSRFYKLPAHLLVEGVSTDDGQDVLEVQAADGLVTITVYTPWRDDPAEDAYNRAPPESRLYSGDRMLALAVFPATAVDLSRHPAAQR